MAVAYIDSSCLVALALGERASGVDVDLASITWMDAPRPLSREIARVLTAGYVRGADCWHLGFAT